MRQRQGFTVVELLITIVVIAILAAISVVAYTGIQNRAHNTAIVSDLREAAQKIELIRVTLDRYPRTVTEFPDDFRLTKSSYATGIHNALYCVNQTTDEYALGVQSKAGTRYMLKNGTVQEGAADVTAAAVCAAVGTTWVSPPVPTSAIHGYNPIGAAPTYTNGWNNAWSWTR